MFENSKLVINLKSLLRFLLNKFNIPYELWFYKDPPEKYHNKIFPISAGNKIISGLLREARPLMISRIGNSELCCIRWFLKYRQGKIKINYTKKIKYLMSNNAGFFPATNEMLDKFCILFLNSSKSADLIGVWYNKYEFMVCNKYCHNALLVELHGLDPYLSPEPWSSYLEDQTVLVIHPFIYTIREQYNNKRTVIFEDKSVLPLFELKTLRAVQSIAGEETPFNDWFDAYEYMCHEISKIDFDIAIIGAGAYGLPLASYVKSLGKVAVHMGGVTQVLFGVKGKRWEDDDYFGYLMNEHWVRPSEHEKPKNLNKVEGGCYW